MALTIYRTLLFAALLPTGLLAILLTAHRFGIDNWQLDRPFYIAFILTFAAMPFWVLYAIRLSFSQAAIKRIALHTIFIWGLVAFYALFVFEVLPSPVYRTWDHLVG